MKSWSVIALLAVLSGTAFAQSPAFQTVDVDSDGLLSLLEAKVVPQVDFFDADANKDGGIDGEEYRIATAPSDE